jgi:hypothetical protein
MKRIVTIETTQFILEAYLAITYEEKYKLYLFHLSGSRAMLRDLMIGVVGSNRISSPEQKYIQQPFMRMMKE